MGCLIKWDKSELTLTQHLDFVGVHFNLQQGLVCPATDKVDKLMSKVALFLNNQFVQVQAQESLLGLLNQLERVMFYGGKYILFLYN